MTTVEAGAKHLRIAATKLRAVAGLVRGKSVEEAIDLLRFCPRRGAGYLLKVVKAAVANADHQRKVDVDRLVVATVRVDEGPRWKRSRPRSRGMAHPILKRTSHIRVALIER